MKTLRLHLPFAIALGLFTLIGHANDLVIRFAAAVGSQPFSCSTSYIVAGQRVRAADFRFYVHGLELVKADGTTVPLQLKDDGRWQQGGVALLDFENKEEACTNGTPDMRTIIEASLPPGDHARTGLRFTLGVPFAQNHQDATVAASPLNLSSLFWNWQGGYKFARVDLVTTDANGTRVGFPIHLGSTGCELDSNQRTSACRNGNRTTVTFADFDPARHVVVADLAALLSGVNLLTNSGPHPGCMSHPNDDDCVSIMKNFGIPFRGVPGHQRVFRLESSL